MPWGREGRPCRPVSPCSPGKEGLLLELSHEAPEAGLGVCGRRWGAQEEGWVGGGGLAFLLLTRHPASSGASSLHVLSSQSLGRVDESAIPI